MATNLDLDPALIHRALELSGERTKKAAVTSTLVSEDVLRAVASSRETSEGDHSLAERMLDALDAGQAAGGDRPGTPLSPISPSRHWAGSA